MFVVWLDFMDPNAAKMRRVVETEDQAKWIAQDWHQNLAGIKSIWIDDLASMDRHVFGLAGYLFTVPLGRIG